MNKAVLIAAAMVMAGASTALWGDEPYFNEIGMAVTDVGGDFSPGTGVALQADGKILVSGAAWMGGGRTGRKDDFMVVRYNPDGSVDSSFDGDGKAITDFNKTYERATDVAVQLDGRIVTIGHTQASATSTDGAWALARYNPNGTPNTYTKPAPKGKKPITIPNFKTLNLSSGGDRPKGLGFQVADGDEYIVVGGHAGAPGALNIVVACYDPDLNLDPTYGVNGIGAIDSGGQDDAAQMRVDPWGRAVLAGGSNGEVALFRFTADGDPDTDFGNTGYGAFIGTGLFAEFPHRHFEALTFQPDGKIVAVGFGDNNGDQRILLARFHDNGVLDESFGDGGTKAYDLAPADAKLPTDIAWDVDGSILVSGFWSFVDSGPAFLLARFDTSGEFVPDFGLGGVTEANFGLNRQIAHGMAVQGWDGKVVLAGEVGDGSSPGTDIGVARFNPDGTLDAAP